MMFDPEPASHAPANTLLPDDFYWEGPTMVFTAAYHLRRGYCCGSGCRHCPYGEDAELTAPDQVA